MQPSLLSTSQHITLPSSLNITHTSHITLVPHHITLIPRHTFQGLDPRSLDFLVSNAGALVWHAAESDQATNTTQHALAPSGNNSGGGGSSSQPGGDGRSAATAGSTTAEDGSTVATAATAAPPTCELTCDDGWERFVDWRWDERVVRQVGTCGGVDI